MWALPEDLTSVQGLTLHNCLQTKVLKVLGKTPARQEHSPSHQKDWIKYIYGTDNGESKNLQDQINEEEIGNLIIQSNDSKNDPKSWK